MLESHGSIDLVLVAFPTSTLAHHGMFKGVIVASWAYPEVSWAYTVPHGLNSMVLTHMSLALGRFGRNALQEKASSCTQA